MKKEIKGFPDYTIDEYGNVFSAKSGRVLRGSVMLNGYISVELFSASGHSKRLLVHRLVAEAFLPNPSGLPIINHKDEDKANNAASNLEWCSHKYNVNYGTAPERRTKALEDFRKSEKLKTIARANGRAASRPVAQTTRAGDLIATFDSVANAASITGVNNSHICETCKGKRKSAGGYAWRYIERSEDLSVFL